MTRINLVHPSELHSKHLVAEYREIVRVFSLARNCQNEIHKVTIPDAYKLGTNHVRFFYDKLAFVSDRYDSLCEEMVLRNFAVNRVSKDDLLRGIDKQLIRGYNPTKEAITLNRERIIERMPKPKLKKEKRMTIN
jgi:deoxyribonuclease (pyrimidine dimer)